MKTKLKKLFPFSMRDLLITAGILSGATLICTLLRFIDDGDIYVSMIFLLAVLLVSRFTTGYFFGLTAAISGVFFVNYIFTYPYFEFNIALSGYPITTVSMLAVSIVTCAMTSQLKEHEKVLLSAERENLRNNLLKGISHDLRTPLTSISGAAAAIRENDSALSSEERIDLLCEIEKDSQWLIRMVENLLSITRMENTDSRIEKTGEVAEEIAFEAVQKVKKRYSDAKIEVSMPEKLLFVPMDALLIEQVLINLLENSIRHGKNEEKISLEIKEEKEYAVFSVSDNGEGFKRASVDELIGGYCDTDSSGGDKTKNMGIGLSVCRAIINAHGGKLYIESVKNPAKISFRLSLNEGDESK